MSWVRKHDVAVFLALAFLLSWWPWPLVLLNPRGIAMVPFGPIIAALVVAAASTGWTGVKELLAGLAHVRVAVFWYLVAFLLPPALAFAALIANFALGTPPPSSLPTWQETLTMFVFITLVGGPLVEEVGWRGFLLPRLLRTYSPLVATGIVWVVWSLWHLPLLISDPSNQRPPAQFILVLLGYSLVLTWVYLGTRASLFVLVLMHGVINTSVWFLFGASFGEAYGRWFWIYAALWIAVGAVLVLTSRVSAEKESDTALRSQEGVGYTQAGARRGSSRLSSS